jgi:hypothetical protein
VAKWKNFQVWHGRWPHWRADGVVYFASFRHRRLLDDDERRFVFTCLMRADGKRWRLLALGVAPDHTALLAKMLSGQGGGSDLTKVLEGAKKRAGERIVARSGEKFPPFGTESFDRIVRDEEELGMLWAGILASLEDGAEACGFLHVTQD